MSDDSAEKAEIETQGFAFRFSNYNNCSHGSCSTAGTENGAIVACVSYDVFGDGVGSSICLRKCNSLETFSFGHISRVYTTPMDISCLTAAYYDGKTFLSWKEKIGGVPPMPKGVDDAVKKGLAEDTRRAVASLPEKARLGGTYYTFLTSDNTPEKICEAPSAVFTSSPLFTGGNEAVWAGIKDGKAQIYLSSDLCTSFKEGMSIPVSDNSTPCKGVSLTIVPGGRLIAAVLCGSELYAAYSDDLGHTWSVAKPLDIQCDSSDISANADGIYVLFAKSTDRRLSLRCRQISDDCVVCGDEKVIMSSIGFGLDSHSTSVVSDKFFTAANQRFGIDSSPSVLFSVWKYSKDENAVDSKAVKKGKKK